MQTFASGRLATPAWVNGRSVLGLVLFVSSLIAGRAVMAASDTRIPVLVAERALATGTTLTAGDLATAEANLGPDQAGLYLSDVAEVEGLVVRRPLSPGEMVPLDSVGSEVSPQRVVTIPIEPEHAAGGRLAPGDLVDVWATFVHEDVPVTKLIVGSVEVVSLVNHGGLVGDESLSGVSVAVPPEAAPRVVLALRAGDIDILASDGTTSSGARQTLTVEEL